MKHAIRIRCCAVVALLLMPIIARSQEQPITDLFGSDVGGTPPADPASPVEKSLLDGLEPVAAERDRDFCKCVGEAESPTVAKIEAALASPLRSTGLDFTDMPLEQVTTVLEDDYGIPIELDMPALDEIGIGPDEPVTVSLHGISLRSALRLTLKQISLTYIIKNEVLMITTPEEAEQELVICVHDVRDLVDGSKGAPDFDSLIEVIVSCVHTETWAKNGGGEAEIRPLKPGLLVISQMQAVQDEVSGLLATIRSVRKQSQAVQGNAPGPAPGRERSGGERGASGGGGSSAGRGLVDPQPAKSD